MRAMRYLILATLLLSPVLARATAYTATCPSMTIHAGDLITPGLAIYNVKNSAGTSVGAGTAIFATAPAPCTLTATSASAVGSYTSTMNTGTLANPGTDTITYVNGSTSVISPDGIGAQLVDSIAFPSGFTSAAAYPALDVTSNPVCNMDKTGANATTNQDCQTYLLAAVRGAQQSKGTCNGTTTLAWVSGANYAGMTAPSGSTAINVAGVWYHVVSVTSSTALVLDASCPTQTNVAVSLPRMKVAAVNGSTTVTWVSGPQFTSAILIAGNQLLLGNGNYIYKVSSVTDATHLVLATAYAQTSTTVPMYLAQLFNQTGAGQFPLYLFYPAGTYLLNDTVMFYGNYMSYWGVGPSSILKLAPNSPAFQGAATPFLQPPTNVTASAFHIFFRNLSVEVGVGNPSAVPFQFPMNNYAAARNMAMWCDDSNCPEVLNMSRNLTGPEMIRNDAFYGGKIGVLGGNITYNITMENITVEGQTTDGIVNAQNKIQVRHALFDEPGIPMMTNNNVASSAVLMDSEGFDHGGALCFQNSASSGTPASTFYFLNVQVHGSCTTTVSDWGTGTLVQTTGDIVEQWTGTAQSLFFSGSSPHALALSFPETPQASDPAVSTWPVLGTAISTWPATIAAGAATTIYAPPGQYAGTGTINITVPDTVNHLQFFDAMDTPGLTYTLALTVAGTSTTPLIIEDCPQNQCTLSHTGSRTVVLLDTNLHSYTAGLGAGTLFVDDAILGGSATLANGQLFYARQLNMEDATATKMTCAGCTAVVFGYKTEHNGDLFDATAGAQINIFGFSALGDPPTPGTGGNMFGIVDSSLFATGSEIVQGTNPEGFATWVIETLLGSTLSLTIPGSELTNANLNMYYSFGAATPPAAVSVQIQGTRLQGVTIQ